MNADSLDILYEDNHCLAVRKSGGVLSTHFQGADETLDRLVKQYLKEKHGKPGNVFLGIVHRLDRPVSGVLLFARTSKAAARLAQQFREGTVEKIYWAVVEGQRPDAKGELEDWLKKDERAGRVRVVAPNFPGSRRAALAFETCGSCRGLHGLQVRPRTGRTHQLRVQLAHAGHSIYGDTCYGSSHSFGRAIALHARSLAFRHPVRDEVISLTAELPPEWKRFAPLFREVHR